MAGGAVEGCMAAASPSAECGRELSSPMAALLDTRRLSPGFVPFRLEFSLYDPTFRFLFNCMENYFLIFF
jgi:hypothetical protein